MVSPLDMSAVDLARRVAARELSAREVVGAFLDRVAEVDPTLNAVVSLRAEAALVEAKAADESAPRGPLHGVPFTVKDWIDAAGLPCAGGQEAHRDRMPARDATAVARLRAAGGILLGKTAAGPDNPVYGRTNNPHDPRYSPAGSSSGEAAIIAAGGSPLGLGSDSGGSIRQPAHCCGIAGLRPTTGRVPLTGHFPFICATTDPRTVIGPLARHVADEWVDGGGFDPAGLGPMSATRVERSLFEWDRFRRRMLPFVDEYPLVLSPAAEKPAVWHGEDPGGIPYTLTWSLAGYPAVVVRAGTTVDGLPVGVQIAAAPWREDLALAAASVVERAMGGR